MQQVHDLSPGGRLFNIDVASSYVGIGGPFRGDLMGRLENHFR